MLVNASQNSIGFYLYCREYGYMHTDGQWNIGTGYLSGLNTTCYFRSYRQLIQVLKSKNKNTKTKVDESYIYDKKHIYPKIYRSAKERRWRREVPS